MQANFSVCFLSAMSCGESWYSGAIGSGQSWRRYQRAASGDQLRRNSAPGTRKNGSDRHASLAVVDGERWVGMLSMRDLMRVELSERGDEIKLLHEYIEH